MSIFLKKVYKYINTFNMLSTEDKVIVGLSGGADSVCLLLALWGLRDKLMLDNKSIIAVHINHMIRGDEADEDEAFAKSLCDGLGVEFVSFSKDVKSYAKELGSTVEEAGRQYRYSCFNRVLEERGFDKIAVAHNKNDVAETVLFNIIRGSNLRGAAGVPPVRDNIIRPLLDCTRNEIEAYLESIGQDYRTDRTNLTIDYDRNKIRHIVLPTLVNLNDKAIEHISSFAEEARESDEYINCEVVRRFEKIASQSSGRITLELLELRKMDAFFREHIVYEALTRLAERKKDITKNHILAIENIINSSTGSKVEMPYGITVRVNYEELIFEKSSEAIAYFYEISGNSEYQITNWGNLEVVIHDDCNVDIPKNIYTKVADYGKIKESLCLRTPQEDDYIIIDVLGNKKKLSRVFIDNKIDRNLRSNWPVIACGDEVIWAIGLRYNERFRVDDTTEKIICFSYVGRGEEYVRKNRRIDKPE